MVDLGICFHRSEAAASVVERARQAEILGFDEFWVIEDCFYTSGPTLAAAALTATEEIMVGIGIVPVVARTAAITAMEFATLAELAPGRFHAGMGHGVQSWMAQMGVRPASPLTALRETFEAVGGLLRGERLTADGRYVTLDDVALEPAPSQMPLLSAGVRGPRSMQVAGQVADGVILADFVSPEYVRWVREQTGCDDHRITVFAEVGIAEGDALADIRAGVGAFMATVAADAPMSLQLAPFWSALSASAASDGWEAAIAAMPDMWWTQISGVGTPDAVRGYVAALGEAGADAVCFFPSPVDPLNDVAEIAGHLVA